MNKFLYLFLALLTSQSFSGPIKVINIESNSQSLKEEIYRSFPQKTGEQFNFNVINEFIKEKSRDRKFKKLSFEYDHKSQSLTFKVSSHPKLDSQTFDIGKSFPDYSKIKIELEENTSFVYGSYIDRESIRQKKDSIRSLLSSQGYIIDRISHEISLVPERENWSRLRFNIEIAGVESTQAIRLQGFSKDSATELVQLLNEREFLKTDSQHFFKNEGGKNEFVSKFSSQLNIKLLNNILEEFSAQKRKEGFLNYGLESYVDEYENYNELVLKQNKGKYFNLQFRGNVAIWENQLRDRLMTKILSLNLSYNNSESVKLIENEYKKLGYKNVVVKSESTNSQETNNILFHVTEGERFQFGNVNFIQSIPSKGIDRAAFRWKNSLSGPYSKLYFNQNRIEENLNGLLGEIVGLGYANARITKFKFKERTESKFVDLVVTLRTGGKFSVKNVSITGISSNNRNEISKKLSKLKGKHLDLRKVVSLIEELRDFYIRRGYLDIIVPRKKDDFLILDEANREATIVIDISEGPKSVIGNIDIEGSGSTRPTVILRELRTLKLNQGSSLSPYKTREFEQNLLGLGIFESVEVVPMQYSLSKESNRKVVDLLIKVREGPAGSIEFGPGFRTDLGVIGVGEFNYRNMWGLNRSVFLRTQLSHKVENFKIIEQKHSLSFIEPYLFNQDLKMRLNLSFEHDDETVIDEGLDSGFLRQETSFSIGFEKKLTKYLTAYFDAYEFSLPKIEEIDDANKEDRRYIIGSSAFELRYDSRNNIFNPSKGFIFQNRVEYASPYLGSDSEANLIIYKSDLSFYKKILNRPVLAFSFGYSRLWSLQNSDGIPENKRLVLGGRSSLRSVEENSLRFDRDGILDQQAYYGRFEYRDTAFDNWGYAFFFEAARVEVLSEVFPNVKDDTDLRYGLGMGLRYQTPVGPLSLDLAFNPKKKGNERKARFILSIGSF